MKIFVINMTQGLKIKKVLFISFKKRFKCMAGFFGCPWYFIDIVNKIYKLGRPGISYGKIIGDYAITFEFLLFIGELILKMNYII